MTISWGGCSCGLACVAVEPFALALRGAESDTVEEAGASVAGEARPTDPPPARGLLVLPACGPPRPLTTDPSACRINKPIEPSFFFVLGIILRRIDSLARAHNSATVQRGVPGGARHALIVYLFTCRGWTRSDKRNASWVGGSKGLACSSDNIGQRSPSRRGRAVTRVIISRGVGLTLSIREQPN